MKFLQNATRTIRVCCFFLTVLVSCLVLQQYFLRNVDHNTLRVEGYYQEERNSLDVVLIGASDIYTSFMPGRAYEQFGFTGYLLASESITASGVETAVKEVVRTQHPGLIVIEANAFLYGNAENEDDEAHLRKFFDNLPLSRNKLDYILKNVPEDKKAEYLFPFVKYHGLWNEYPDRFFMTANDLSLDVRGYNYLKGFRTTAEIYKTDRECFNSRIADEHGELDLDPKLEKKLTDLLDYCKSQDLNVVFVRAPHYVTAETYDRVKRSNRMAGIVKEYGYDYYRFENDAVSIGIDEKRDFYNDDHMNVYGALKFTDYLASKIVTEQKLRPDPLTDSQREAWQDTVSATNQLYRYCDHLMSTGDVRGAQEDVLTLLALGDYSDAPLTRR